MGDKRHQDLDVIEKVTKLEEAVQRLMNENAAHRENQERMNIIVRKRAPKADGLSLHEMMRAVLDERDEAQKVILEHRETIKKGKDALVNSNNTREAYDILNLFLLKSKPGF